jgi:hypothetical protein
MIIWCHPNHDHRRVLAKVRCPIFACNGKVFVLPDAYLRAAALCKQSKQIPVMEFLKRYLLNRFMSSNFSSAYHTWIP